MKIALTGGIACGKSLVASYAMARGVAVCEADTLAHQAMAEGSEVYRAIVARFGADVVGVSGAIDRARLARQVFASEREREALNAIVHPVVARAWAAWLEAAASPVAMVVVPLLFEAGYDAGWDAVICVCASAETQMARLKERGLTAHEARARMQAQWPGAEKAARSDYVLWNDGNRECLKAQFVRVLDDMKRGQ